MLFLFYIVIHITNLAFGKDEIKRYINDDGFKKPIFGSYMYDPISQKFENSSGATTAADAEITHGTTDTTTFTATSSLELPTFQYIKTRAPYRKHEDASGTETSVKIGSAVTSDLHLRSGLHRENPNKEMPNIKHDQIKSANGNTKSDVTVNGSTVELWVTEKYSSKISRVEKENHRK